MQYSLAFSIFQFNNFAFSDGIEHNSCPQIVNEMLYLATDFQPSWILSAIPLVSLHFSITLTISFYPPLLSWSEWVSGSSDWRPLERLNLLIYCSNYDIIKHVFVEPYRICWWTMFFYTHCSCVPVG